MYPFCSFRGPASVLSTKMLAEIGTLSPHGAYLVPEMYVLPDRSYSRGGTSSKFTVLTGTYASADYVTFATLKMASAITYWELLARSDASVETWYGLLYQGSNGAWTILRFNGGSSVSLGTWTSSLTVGVPANIRMEITGSGATVSITVYKDGVSMGSASDTSGSRITTAGLVGVGFATQSGNGTDTTGAHWKDVGAVSVGTGIIPNTNIMKIGGGNVTIRVRKSGGSSWVSGTTFAVTGGTAAFVSKSFVDANTYDVTVSPGTTEAEITIQDSVNSYTTLVPVVKGIPTLADYTDTYVAAGTTWNHRISSGAATTNTPGARTDFAFTGTSLQIQLDPAPLGGATSANFPYFRYWIDNGAPVTTQLTSTTDIVTLASGLAAGTHAVRFEFVRIKYDGSDAWDGTAVLKILRWFVDGNATTVTGTDSATVPTYNALFFGDSISSGVKVDGISVPSDNDSSATMGSTLGAALDTRIHIFGFPGQGWGRPGFGTVQPFYNSAVSTGSSQTFGWYDSTHAWNLPSAPDYVFVMHGTNDAISGTPTSNGTVTSLVQAWIQDVRSRWPLTQIVVLAFGGYKTSAIQSGFNNASSTTNKTFIDLLPYSRGCANWNSVEAPRLFTKDGLHPDRTGQAVVANGIAQELLTASAGGGETSHTFIGG